MQPVCPEHYAGKCWQRYTSYNFAAPDHVVPLVAAEIATAALAMPLAFMKHGETFVLVAVLSPISGENLYVGRDGKWCGGYVPSHYRSYPFGMLRVKGREHPVLCVDETSGLITEQQSGAEPFFDSEGELSKSVQDVVNFLRQVEENRILTKRAVNALVEVGLMIPWPAKVTIDKQEQKIAGLYRIDAEKLDKLEDEIFLDLRRKGALAVAWGQLFSQGVLPLLERLAALRKKVPPTKEDVMTHFSRDDIFHF